MALLLAGFEISSSSLSRGELLPWIVTIIILVHLLVVVFWIFRVANEVSSQPARPLANLNKPKQG